MPRYDYQVRLVGGPLDKTQYGVGNISPKLLFPVAWFEDLGDSVALRSTSNRIAGDFRKKYSNWIDVKFAVYEGREGQQNIFRYYYSHSIVVYRCSGMTKKGRRCMNYVDEPDGKCRFHATQAGAAG